MLNLALRNHVRTLLFTFLTAPQTRSDLSHDRCILRNCGTVIWFVLRSPTEIFDDSADDFDAALR